jgi:hypothetical protein
VPAPCCGAAGCWSPAWCSALWSYVLLGRAASWHPWLRIAILVAGLGAGALLALLGQAGATGLHNGQAGPGGGNQNGGGMGGAGGLLAATTPSSALVKLLGAGHGKYDWVAATVGSNNAAGYQLATGYPVMAIGGFNGTDAYPTLARFEAYVKAGRIHYFISAQTMGGSSGSGAAQRIARWVAQHYPASTVGGVTVYDLTAS